jgi:[ribosomal protein S5]-alanine N-acetyltransferase
LQLETERLLLRLLSFDDLDVLAAFYADPEVMRYLGAGRTLSRDESKQSLRRMLRSFELDGFGQLAIVRKVDHELIGRCGFLVWEAATLTPTTEAESTGPTELEVGYELGRDFWGQGYATEAATAVRDQALGPMGRTRLIAFVRPENLASARVAEKLGMRHERDVDLLELPARLYALGNEPAR